MLTLLTFKAELLFATPYEASDFLPEDIQQKQLLLNWVFTNYIMNDIINYEEI